MPERTAYDEAMLLSQARLQVPNPDLKQGQVNTTSIQTVAGSMKRPWGIQGGFAVVYKFATQSGKTRALRCFLVKMEPDTQYRYERISSYFTAYAPEIAVEFIYHTTGILLKETVNGQIQKQSYPLVEMEWIEGLTLVEYVDELCRNRDTATLGTVLQQWETIIRKMHQVNMSHGDLAGVNVMVRPNGRLVLIDYDGVYIPDFAALRPVVLGQVDYQHPQMAQRPFNERTDDFSAWVIYTALLALHLQPELWDHYTQHNANGKLMETNLLFRKSDFAAPDQSVLFADLSRIQDKRLQKAVQLLKQACTQSVSQVPPFNPPDRDDDKKEALAKLERAIQDHDDEAILQAWIPSLLDNYGPAQQYASRVALARQIIEALKRFQAALKSNSLQQIVNSYDPIFLYSKQFKPEQGEVLLMALPFAEAYQNNDDQAIVASWEAIEESQFKSQLTLTNQEEQRVALAQQRKTALVRFRMALMQKIIQPIVSAYDDFLLGTSSSVTTRERELLRVAQEVAQAFQSDDDQAIVAASEAIENFSYRTDFVFTTQEQQRIELAKLRKVALVKFRMSLMSKNMKQMVASYDWILDDSTSITAQDRDLLKQAKAFIQAAYKNNDQAMLTIWESIQQAGYQRFFQLSPQELERINRARLSQSALPLFRNALTSKNARQIVAAYDPVLDNEKSITSEERTLLRLTRDLVLALQHDDDQEIASLWDELLSLPHQPTLLLSEQEQQRITLAQKRKLALLRFRMALISKRLRPIVAAYDPVLDTSKNVTASEKKQIALARQLLQAYQNDDDPAFVRAWNAIQNSPYRQSFVLTDLETQRLARANGRGI
jgi:hypothetical protein